jgi:hypothetical protein
MKLLHRLSVRNETMNLADALELFNRKERNLLVRLALGHKKENPLRLSDSFRRDVGTKLAIDIPLEAWWATDFHFSWLAGALRVHAQGAEDSLTPQQNLPSGARYLVEGNQEDIDLVIATGTHLMMIEAKAYGAWSNSQMASKIQRLNLLHQYYETLPRASEQPIQFHFLLISPTEPERLLADWPTWVYKGGEKKIPWIPLPLEETVFEVTRCDREGNATKDGSLWHVTKTRSHPRPIA